MGYTLIHYLQLDRVSLPDLIAFALFISLSLSLRLSVSLSISLFSSSIVYLYFFFASSLSYRRFQFHGSLGSTSTSASTSDALFGSDQAKSLGLGGNMHLDDTALNRSTGQTKDAGQ